MACGIYTPKCSVEFDQVSKQIAQNQTVLRIYIQPCQLYKCLEIYHSYTITAREGILKQ